MALKDGFVVRRKINAGQTGTERAPSSLAEGPERENWGLI